MKLIETELKHVYKVQLQPMVDERGMFERMYGKEEFASMGIAREIVQVNRSVNKLCGTVRGMHFQNEPYAELKMVTCIRGGVNDYVLDLRKDSPTFLKHITVELSESNNVAVIIPEGCAHGFQTLEPNTELLYFHSNVYRKEAEGAVNIFDPLFGIQLSVSVEAISEKDRLVKMVTNITTDIPEFKLTK
jgi:dTDP-4-dehydrorhamnose 3,5-epimerase